MAQQVERREKKGGIGGSLFLLTSIPISTLLLLPPRQGREREIRAALAGSRRRRKRSARKKDGIGASSTPNTFSLPFAPILEPDARNQTLLKSVAYRRRAFVENPFFLSFPSRLPSKPLLSRSGSVERLGNGSENGGAYLAPIYPPLSCTLGSVPQLLNRAQKSGKGEIRVLPPRVSDRCALEV